MIPFPSSVRSRICYTRCGNHQIEVESWDDRSPGVFMKVGRIISRHRGAVLLATLFLVLVISMFMGAASQVGLRTLFTTGATAESALAESAAESGLQFALFRLRQNARWRGDGNGVVVDTPELLVREDRGNVIGFMSDGRQFRIRFNFQDGEGQEGLSDPAIWIDHGYVSINNLLSSAPRAVPRGDGVAGSVTASSQIPYMVPEFTACLIVEGRAGAAIKRGDYAAPPRGRVSTTVLEAFYRVDDISDLQLDAAVMSGRDFEARLPESSGTVTVETRDGLGQPRVRSKDKVAVSGGETVNFVSPDGQVLSRNGKLHARDGGLVDTAKESASASFYELGWDDVAKPDPSSSQTLAAGTYVWWKDGSLHYYDLNFEDYVKYIKKNPHDPGIVDPPLPSTMKRKKSSRTLVVTGDVQIVAAAKSGLDSKAEPASEFSLIPRGGAPEGPPLVDPGGGADPLVLGAFFYENQEVFRDFVLGRWGASHDFYPGGGDYSFAFTGANDPDTFSMTISEASAPILWIGDGDFTNGPMSTRSVTEKDFTKLFSELSQVTQHALAYMDETGAGEAGGIDLPGVDDDLGPADITLDFAPEVGANAILSSPGDVRVGTQLKGQGGSIVSGGSIRVVGFGADFAANPDAESGISMYARRNIEFSTYRRNKDKKAGKFQDVKIKGVLYAWGNIKAAMGHDKVDHWGRFGLEGAMVAYGGKPGNAENPGIPGSGHGGRVAMMVADSRLIFDPAYLISLMGDGPENVPMRRTLWKRY